MSWETKNHFSFFEEKLFLYLRCKRELVSRAIGVLLLANVFKMGREVLLFWHMTEWHSWKISLMSPFPLLPKIPHNWRKPPEFLWMSSKCEYTLFSSKVPYPSYQNFLNDGAFYSGGEVFCIPLAAKQKGPTDFINTLREWVRDKTHLEA